MKSWEFGLPQKQKYKDRIGLKINSWETITLGRRGGRSVKTPVIWEIGHDGENLIKNQKGGGDGHHGMGEKSHLAIRKLPLLWRLAACFTMSIWGYGEGRDTVNWGRRWRTPQAAVGAAFQTTRGTEGKRKQGHTGQVSMRRCMNFLTSQEWEEGQRCCCQVLGRVETEEHWRKNTASTWRLKGTRRICSTDHRVKKGTQSTELCTATS